MLSDLNALEVRLESLDRRLGQTREDLRKIIAEEGETTRRHFNIMVERMSEMMKPIAEAVGHHSNVLDDHESRLQQLENPR